MRVVHVIETLAPRYGGPVTVLKQLASEQQRRGLQVSILTTAADYPKGRLFKSGWGTLEDSTVPVYYADVQFEPLKVSFDLASELRKSVRSTDIFHIHGLYRYPPSYAAFAARKAGKPYIIRPFGSLDPFLYKTSSRSLVLKRLYERFIDLPNLQGATAVHFTAEEERAKASYLGLQSDSFVVPNPLDLNRFERLPAKGGFRARHGLGSGPLILFLGRIHFKKGIDLLISAFAKVRGELPGARLVIAGPENDFYGAELRDLVSKLGVDDVVRFVGPLAGAQVLDAYTDADLFALTSHAENFGMTVVEAMACGLPVLVSDQVNISPLISREDAGEIVPCDVSSIAGKLVAILKSPERLKELGSRGKRMVREHFALDSVASSLEVEYLKCIRKHAPAV